MMATTATGSVAERTAPNSRAIVHVQPAYLNTYIAVPASSAVMRTARGEEGGGGGEEKRMIEWERGGGREG